MLKAEATVARESLHPRLAQESKLQHLHGSRAFPCTLPQGLSSVDSVFVLFVCLPDYLAQKCMR